jgi:hypothetical protein
MQVEVGSVVASRGDDGWRIIVFQNTPAAFHGRPGESVRPGTFAMRARAVRGSATYRVLGID